MRRFSIPSSPVPTTFTRFQIHGGASRQWQRRNACGLVQAKEGKPLFESGAVPSAPAPAAPAAAAAGSAAPAAAPAPSGASPVDTANNGQVDVDDDEEEEEEVRTPECCWWCRCCLILDRCACL